MEFAPVFEKINYDLDKGRIKEQIKAECKTDVRAETVGTVLGVWCSPFVDGGDLLDGKVGYSGRALFYISYLDLDGNVRKVECGNEFTGVIKDSGVESSDRAFLSANVDRVDADTSGAFLSVSAYLTVSADLTSPTHVSALTSGENLVVDAFEIEQIKGIGEKTAVYPLEEQFELAYPVAEVLNYTASAVITAAQCGVGSIIVDGEVLLSLIVLQKNDKRDIIKENKTLPFRAEIDFEEAMPQMQAQVMVKERSFKLDVSVDAETGKSTVNASVGLKFIGRAFKSENLTLAKDVFSVDNEIEIERAEFDCVKHCEQRTLTATVKGRAITDELPIGAGVLALSNEKVEITEQSCGENSVKFTGVLTATAFLRDGEFKPFVKKVEIPFECVFDTAISCGANIMVKVNATGGKAKIISATEIELEATLNFTVYPTEKCSYSVVKGLKTIGEKNRNQSAISVYIPTEGEDLWSLSKRLNVCPESLMESNRELCFPLKGDERIVIYRQK